MVPIDNCHSRGSFGQVDLPVHIADLWHSLDADGDGRVRMEVIFLGGCHTFSAIYYRFRSRNGPFRGRYLGFPPHFHAFLR